MDNRGQSLVGAIIGVLVVAITALLGIIILSGFVEYCPDSGELAAACDSVSSGAASFLGGSVGPAPILLVILALLAGAVQTVR